MARPRKQVNTHLPDNMYIRRRKRKSGKIVTYFTYRLTGKKESMLGTDYNLACLKAAKFNLEREETSEKITFTMVAKRFKNEVIPNRKPSTARSYLTLLKPLLLYFESAPLDQIEAQDIAKYLKWRQDTSASANNEYALFNQIWGYAREWGYTNLPSPTNGVKRYKINRRDFYVDDEIYSIIYQMASPILQDLMDVAYLIGQRPVDVVNIKRSHIKQGYLHIVQQKTTAKVRFEVTGKLAEIINRHLQLNPHSEYVFLTKHGNRIKTDNLRRMFANTRNKAISIKPEFATELARFQFRDLRAKSGTDKALKQGLKEAQKQLGHTTAEMTKTYIRQAIPIAPLSNTPSDKKGD